MTDDVQRQMRNLAEQDQRRDRYARAITKDAAAPLTGTADAVMAVADAEQADVRARLTDAENALADLRGKVEAEAQWLNAHHDGSLVTSDYPMVARRIRATLDGKP